MGLLFAWSQNTSQNLLAQTDFYEWQDFCTKPNSKTEDTEAFVSSENTSRIQKAHSKTTSQAENIIDGAKDEECACSRDTNREIIQGQDTSFCFLQHLTLNNKHRDTVLQLTFVQKAQWFSVWPCRCKCHCKCRGNVRRLIIVSFSSFLFTLDIYSDKLLSRFFTILLEASLMVFVFAW